MNGLWNVIIEVNSRSVDTVPNCTVECWEERGWVVLGNATDYFKASETADLLSSFN